MTATLTSRTAAAGSATATTSADLFVVSTHKVRDQSAPNGWVPYGTEHAWQPGTRSTLCGEYIHGWEVFWERHFSARPPAACAACVEMTLPESSRRRLDHFELDRQPTSS